MWVILLILCIRDYTSPKGGDSLIDLSFISNPSLLCSCTVIPPLANSDHYGVHTVFSLKSSAGVFTSQCPWKVWCYAHADFSKACHLISDTDWNSIISDNIVHSWMQWQENFHEKYFNQSITYHDWIKASSHLFAEGMIWLKEQRILHRTKADTNQLEIELYLNYAMQKWIISIN